ncbi:metal-dependent hydrolase [Sphingobacterium spiritivorum]|uniref:Metallo-beta-lactamase domain protein n=1 Tax=Sphingobacterium spiritivorum ATCC 33861 TaxID=525373 RepID=D7VKT3_SPHSI|nr:metal-dependent hydrolase [Sphingobacterium spiritivorum]EFK58885.1 metallo-beta-lactamase domain protein [Sphingobacterium spiritivorum ATCC 33861]QQT34240.1 metal-dependent hydrolase [Sphingobacterium spiritivorum]WQD35079.1 metal-dependent hydrolase [Sphingobacterium spiritivorum]SUI99331.1 metal-dependent hydrolase [Sphingobacterium spiritivorum]
MKITYYGQSCVLFDFDGHQVLLDPFVTYNPIAEHVDVNALNPEYIFVSHAHQDHVADLLTVQKNSNAIVATVVETAAWVRKQGVPDDKVVEFNLGGTIETTFGKVKMVIAIHTNSTPDGAYGGWPVGYVFFAGDKKIYFAGDTALTYDMKLLEDLQLDWAFLPIGGHYTMDVEDAVKAAQFINCKHIVGIHYNTFPPITIDVEVAKRKFSDAGLQLSLPGIGETISL